MDNTVSWITGLFDPDIMLGKRAGPIFAAVHKEYKPSTFISILKISTKNVGRKIHE
ncbi:MAG: hypothetical protein HXS44_04665 [Theionarchaea archaeon]|nr:hypothetical protein [Theionarchaea archaeon]